MYRRLYLNWYKKLEILNRAVQRRRLWDSASLYCMKVVRFKVEWDLVRFNLHK